MLSKVEIELAAFKSHFARLNSQATKVTDDELPSPKEIIVSSGYTMGNGTNLPSY